MTGILSWLVFGLIAGLLAKAIMPGKNPQGCFITIALGIVGAMIGGFIGVKIGWAAFRALICAASDLPSAAP